MRRRRAAGRAAGRGSCALPLARASGVSPIIGDSSRADQDERRPAVTEEHRRLAASPYITGPMIQGANSSSPTPLSSLLDFLPEATATISSKICPPTAGSGVPSRITPQLMSMSSSMWRYMSELVASLIEGTGLQPKTEPRPVVKQMRLQPPATRPVIDTEIGRAHV